ncbi:hypothetical protein BDV18DRAFT_155461 [Aspergillus unguis]
MILTKTITLAILTFSSSTLASVNRNHNSNGNTTTMPMPMTLSSMPLTCPQIESVKARLNPLINISLPPQMPEYIVPKINAAKSLARGYMDMMDAFGGDMQGDTAASTMPMPMDMDMSMDMDEPKANNAGSVMRSRITRNRTNMDMKTMQNNNSLMARQAGNPDLGGIVLTIACEVLTIISTMIEPEGTASEGLQGVMAVMGCGAGAEM